MKIPFVPPVGEITGLRQPIPRIYWPSIDGDQPNFPLGAIFWNKANDKYLEVFFDALTQAIDRIWIIDRYLLDNGDKSRLSTLALLCKAMEESRVRSLQIFTFSKNRSEIKDAEQRITSARNKPKHGRQTATDIKIKGHHRKEINTATDLIHDRFAILDDSLWHFGADVGGVHVELNAASGPWCARETKAIEFFEQLWVKDKS